MSPITIPAPSSLSRRPANPLASRRHSPEWPDSLSHLYWSCVAAHLAYTELSELADALHADAPAELLGLVRTAYAHWKATERYAAPCLAAWEGGQHV